MNDYKLELKLINKSIRINIYRNLENETEEKQTYYAQVTTKQFHINIYNNSRKLIIDFLTNENLAKIEYIEKFYEYSTYVLTLTSQALLRLI